MRWIKRVMRLWIKRGEKRGRVVRRAEKGRVELARRVVVITRGGVAGRRPIAATYSSGVYWSRPWCRHY
jgi:hypothetical protein